MPRLISFTDDLLQLIISSLLATDSEHVALWAVALTRVSRKLSELTIGVSTKLAIGPMPFPKLNRLISFRQLSPVFVAELSLEEPTPSPRTTPRLDEQAQASLDYTRRTNSHEALRHALLLFPSALGDKDLADWAELFARSYEKLLLARHGLHAAGKTGNLHGWYELETSRERLALKEFARTLYTGASPLLRVLTVFEILSDPCRGYSSTIRANIAHLGGLGIRLALVDCSDVARHTPMLVLDEYVSAISINFKDDVAEMLHELLIGDLVGLDESVKKRLRLGRLLNPRGPSTCSC